MKFSSLLPFLFRRAQLVEKDQALSGVGYNGGGGWFGIIREAFSGAYQHVVEIDAPKNILAFSAVYASVTMIAGDIAKLWIKLVEEDPTTGICTEIRTGSHAFLPILRKPNPYQTLVKFLTQWIVSKLLYGNAYALKEYDNRGVVVGLYILDPQRVTPLITPDGGIYYRLASDYLARIPEGLTVPSSAIIHDPMCTLWHPLIGVSPIFACGMSATMGNKIQSNSTKFFLNMSRPSGALTAPGTINTETANRIKKDWEDNFSGLNLGRLAVLGDGLKYESMTIPAQDAQLIEQLKWTVEDVARCFHVPMFKLGGPIPPRESLETLNQMYYSDCLQTIIESFESALNEGLALPKNYYTEVDLSGLLRMDTAARYESLNKAISGGWMAPNEARARENMRPVTGGDSPMIQQQNYSLAALAKRDAQDDPFAKKPKPSPAAPAATPGDNLPPSNQQNDEAIVAEFKDFSNFIKGELCHA